MSAATIPVHPVRVSRFFGFRLLSQAMVRCFGGEFEVNLMVDCGAGVYFVIPPRGRT